jgi:hypothetical protein
MNYYLKSDICCLEGEGHTELVYSRRKKFSNKVYYKKEINKV